jgi:uncharacterized SAM-binding protein YcdF (DUF218 family)
MVSVKVTCEEDISRSATNFLIPDSIFPADLAIVFGMTAWHRPTERAVDLYEAGTARRLLFTGGFNSRVGAIEASEMAREALRSGVPGAAILVEDRASNTDENLVFSRRLIEETVGLGTIDTILLVAISFHMRRVLMTAQRTFPPRIALGTASYPSVSYSDRDWFRHWRAGNQRAMLPVSCPFTRPRGRCLRIYINV